MNRFTTFAEASKVDPEDVDACVSYWWSYSFLDGIRDKTLKEKCAISYTRMARFLHDNPDYCTITAVPGLDLCFSCFPLIRRVVTATKLTLTDPEAFLDFCKEYFRERVDHFEKIVAMTHIDLEAEAITECAEYAAKILRKQENEEECDTTTV